MPRKVEKDSVKGKCDVCLLMNKGKNVPAVAFCVVCRKMYCKEHDKLHSSIHESHTMMSVQKYVELVERPETRYCVQHQNKPYIVVCGNCLKEFCICCISPTDVCPQGHSHELLSFKPTPAIEKQSEVAIDQNEESADMLSPTYKEIEEFERETKKLMAELRMTRYTQIQAIEEKYVDLENKLEESRIEAQKTMTVFLEKKLDSMWTSVTNEEFQIMARDWNHHQVNLVGQYTILWTKIERALSKELSKLDAYLSREHGLPSSHEHESYDSHNSEEDLLDIKKGSLTRLRMEPEAVEPEEPMSEPNQIKNFQSSPLIDSEQATAIKKLQIENQRLNEKLDELKHLAGDERSGESSLTESDDDGQPLTVRPPLPPNRRELIKRLKTFCNEFLKLDYTVLIDPDDPCHILIVGDDVTGSTSVSELAKVQAEDESWSCYTITLQNNESNPNDSPTQFAGFKKFRLPNEAETTGVCQLIIKLEDKTSGKISTYAVTAAHILFNAEDNQRIREGADVMSCWDERRNAEQHVYQVQFTGVPGIEPQDDDYELLYAQHPLFIGYRHRVSGGTRRFEKCLNDVALLSLNLERANHLQEKLQRDTQRREGIVKIKYDDVLKIYLAGSNIQISIRGMKGQLCGNTQELEDLDEHGLPHYLLFRLDGTGSLQEGESGSILYELRRFGPRERKVPLGLFIGLPRYSNLFRKGLYQAVILDHALMDIANSYGHEDVTVFRAYRWEFPNSAQPPRRKARPPQQQQW